MLGCVAGIDLIDETFVVAEPAELARIVADPGRWRAWWPDLELTVFMDRGNQGIRWSVTGALVGSTEIWLEPVADGVLVHYYLRADRAGSPLPDTPAGWRAADRLRAARARAWKTHVWALKDEMERGRRPGAPRRSPAKS